MVAQPAMAACPYNSLDVAACVPDACWECGRRTPVHGPTKAADLDKGTVLIMRRGGVTVPLAVQRGVYNLCRGFVRGTDQHSDSG
jgi:hypothetical protein